jgi:hypothetical protein
MAIPVAMVPAPQDSDQPLPPWAIIVDHRVMKLIGRDVERAVICVLHALVRGQRAFVRSWHQRAGNSNARSPR